MGSFSEHFINFVVAHNATVIEAVVFAIMIGSLYLAFRALNPAESVPGPATGGTSVAMPGLDELEKTLQKILEKTSATATSQPAPSEDAMREIESLREKLNARQKEIEEIKNSTKAGGLTGEEKASLEDKVRDLTAKLAEYEIISEDIADLSLYKEENAKLRKEIEGLKSGASTPAATPAPAPRAAEPVAAPPAPAPKPEPEIVVPRKAPPPPPPAEPVAAPAAEAAGVVDDDLMAEFAKAVEQQKGAELSAAPPPPSPFSPEPEAKGDINFDKILTEANNLPEGSDAVTSLEASELNTAKLEGEADKLTGNDG